MTGNIRTFILMAAMTALVMGMGLSDRRTGRRGDRVGPRRGREYLGVVEQRQGGAEQQARCRSPAWPYSIDMVAALAERAGPADASGLCAGVRAAQCLRHRAQSRKFGSGGDAGHPAGAERRVELAGVIATGWHISRTATP